MKTKVLLRFLIAALAVSPLIAESGTDTPSGPPPSAKVRTKYEQVLADARKNPPLPGDIIGIGSSHLAYWKNIAEDLAPLTVHNYGIPGSTMTQAADLFVDHLVIAFKPRAVVLYEGSNDIAAGGSPEAVRADFRRLADRLHAALPKARLYVLGLVPSPGKRFDRIGEVLRTNALLREECQAQAWMTFIDTTTPLLGADGRPRAECFIPGDIHMQPAGYAAWKSAVAPVMVPAEKPFEKGA